MTRGQRKKHLLIWGVLGVILPIAIIYGYFSNQSVSKESVKTEIVK